MQEESAKSQNILLGDEIDPVRGVSSDYDP